MARFEVSARMKVRDGQLEGFKRQAAECIRVTKREGHENPPVRLVPQ